MNKVKLSRWMGQVSPAARAVAAAAVLAAAVGAVPAHATIASKLIQGYGTVTAQNWVLTGADPTFGVAEVTFTDSFASNAVTGTGFTDKYTITLFPSQDVALVNKKAPNKVTPITGMELLSGSTVVSTATYDSGTGYWDLLYSALHGGTFTLEVFGKVVAGSGYNGSFTATPVPEPGTLGLLAAGIVPMLWVMRRRQSNS